MGIARTFQNIRLFNTMTVEENVKVGLHNTKAYSTVSGILRTPAYWRREAEAHERALELLSIFDMQGLANHQAGSLPYGAQRRLEIVRALATNPSLLLLDEKVGLHNTKAYSTVSGILRTPAYWRREAEAHERALELLSIFDMQGLANHQAGSLPYGAQRRLEIVRALATNPSLLLLDEPAAGMNPSETAELMENIVKIRDTFNIAIMLIEHDMNLVMNICEGICVLNFGKVIAKGTAEEIQNNETVIEAYLGKQKEA